MATLADFGILTNRTSGSVKLKCPECSQDRKHKSDPCLSVNIDEGIWNCHNCGWKGSTGNGKNGYHLDKQDYTIPDYNNTPLSDQALEWFLKRGISKATILKYKISESKEFMPQIGKEMNAINFNYFRDEQIVNIKYRDGKKNFKMVSGAELIFYGLDFVKEKEQVVITEGEMDCLSFCEAGVFGVVSVPNGASKGNQKLEYLDNCYQYFENKTKIIIATDNDEAGIALREELARRLGKERCFKFQYPDDCKDANEILVKYGPEYLKTLMGYVLEYPIEGISTVMDIENEIDSVYQNGFPKGVGIGFWQLDNHITFRTGELTTITGIPNSGKSEFLDQIMVKLAELHDWRFGVFSAENQPCSLHAIKLMEKHSGKPFYSNDLDQKISKEDLFSSKTFTNDHFFFVNMNEENCTVDGLLAKCKELVLRKGIKGFLIDPYNYLEHKIPKGYTETQYISEFLTKLSRAAKALDIHVFLVAHPTKLKKNNQGKYEVPGLYDISGSSNFYNKTDNGFSVYRDFEEDFVLISILKIRFKFVGKRGEVKFSYNALNGRYSEM